MLITSEIKNELDQLGIKPKRSLGQNFLINDQIYKKIISTLEISSKDKILEVGPGLGTLTRFLLETGAEIVCVEKDTQLTAYLKEKFKNYKNFKILEEDILNFRPESFDLNDGGYKVVGNIPYYLTSHLLRISFENWPKTKSTVLMVQKEVAQRIVAKPPEMSLLSVSVQYYSDPSIVSYVSKGSFYPIPEVDSAIIKLIPKKTEKDTEKTKKLFKVAQAGFSRKRKQLINNLSLGLKINKKELEKNMTSIGIDPMRRAETLNISEWQKLTDAIFYQD